MRAVISRVSRASITINGRPGGGIGAGLVVLVGIQKGDTAREAAYLAKKCVELRIFEDEGGKMNRAMKDVGGGMMVVSNFTLYADCAHGRRPDFFRAAPPAESLPVYEEFLRQLRLLEVDPVTGEFGAEMQIDHINDGPVTILMDTDQMMKKEAAQ